MPRAVLFARSQTRIGALALAACAALSAAASKPALEQALDGQDRAAMERIAAAATKAADAEPRDAPAQYAAARAQSMLAQLAIELGDKALGKTAAETGIRSARRAAGLKPNDAEYRRILGTLCGQVIPANVLAGARWARCAMDEVNKAVELAPDSSAAWLSHGVGNYYLPGAFGGGVNKAIADLEKAVRLDEKSAEAQLWLGIALRKAGRNADARKAIARSLELNPDRKWAKQQLDKTPAQ